MVIQFVQVYADLAIIGTVYFFRLPNVKLDARLQKAQELISNNEPNKAIKLCRELNGVDSKNAEAWHIMGSACHRSGNLEKARKYLGHAVKLQQESNVRYGVLSI